MDPEPPAISNKPLFVLSFRQRGELAAMVERAGWDSIAARRAENAERRFVFSGASIGLIDARGAFDDGRKAVGMLADPAEANAAALLVLVSKNDVERIGEMLKAGATHYLASPFGEDELAQALRFAERYTARLGQTFGRHHTEGQTGVLELSWQLDLERESIRLSDGLRSMLALQDGAVSKKEFLDALGENGKPEAESALLRVSEGGGPTAFAHNVSNDTGRLIHHISQTANEVIARVEQPDSERDTKALIHRDHLTGLGDAQTARRWIETHLKANQNGAKLALLLISLHRFDMINASFGQGAGDATLQGMARRIERLVGPTPGRKRLLARLAGAEFAIGLSPPTSLQEAELLAGQLVQTIEQPFMFGEQVIKLNARCGVVLGDAEDSDAGVVLRRASAALSETKIEGGQSIRTYGNAEEGDAVRANRLEIDLRPALNHDEIDILFQPQVSVTSGAIVGAEALSRWRHPILGELGAAALFTAAEGADYLNELSNHVQRKALRMAAAWPETLSELRLSINVTGTEITDPNFVSQFSDMVDATGFPRERLTVEVTESGLITDLQSAGERLSELRADGFRVAIDDFGTGYSSLAYLKALPLDYLKIDRRLSQDITGSARDRVVVHGAIEMARSLGLTVIAEGVETAEQLAMLAEEGCAIYQGFLCAPPIDGAALAKLIKQSAD